MWQQLNPGQQVSLGDQLRYIESSVLYTRNIFKVVKTDKHYFEIVAELMDSSLTERYRPKRIVKYLDIGYIDNLEVWID
jgi:hypothetical protein